MQLVGPNANKDWGFTQLAYLQIQRVTLAPTIPPCDPYDLFIWYPLCKIDVPCEKKLHTLQSACPTPLPTSPITNLNWGFILDSLRLDYLQTQQAMQFLICDPYNLLMCSPLCTTDVPCDEDLHPLQSGVPIPLPTSLTTNLHRGVSLPLISHYVQSLQHQWWPEPASSTSKTLEIHFECRCDMLTNCQLKHDFTRSSLLDKTSLWWAISLPTCGHHPPLVVIQVCSPLLSLTFAYVSKKTHIQWGCFHLWLQHRRDNALLCAIVRLHDAQCLLMFAIFIGPLMDWSEESL